MWSCLLAESICPLSPRFPLDMLRYMDAVVLVGVDILILLFFSTSISNLLSARGFMVKKQCLVRNYCFNLVLVILASWFVVPLEAQISKKGW